MRELVNIIYFRIPNGITIPTKKPDDSVLTIS